jgi:hypothetical protein
MSNSDSLVVLNLKVSEIGSSTLVPPFCYQRTSLASPLRLPDCVDLGPLNTRSQDLESSYPNKSILNLLLELRRYFIKVHFGSKM